MDACKTLMICCHGYRLDALHAAPSVLPPRPYSCCCRTGPHYSHPHKHTGRAVFVTNVFIIINTGQRYSQPRSQKSRHPTPVSPGVLTAEPPFRNVPKYSFETTVHSGGRRLTCFSVLYRGLGGSLQHRVDQMLHQFEAATLVGGASLLMMPHRGRVGQAAPVVPPETVQKRLLPEHTQRAEGMSTY